MLETAQAAVKRIRTDPTGFTTSILFTSPTGTTATVLGMHAKVHMAASVIDGDFVNSKRAHISVSESSLTDLGYVTRNANNEIDLKDHRVAVTDSAGILCQYIIRECFPDERLGLLVLFLGDFQ